MTRLTRVASQRKRSSGYETSASTFLAARETARVGADVVRQWAASLPAGATVVDVGCGGGWPVTEALVDAGCAVWGLDESATMVETWRARFPCGVAVCEPIETSTFFHRRFHGAVLIGVLFLSEATRQPAVPARLAAALEPGGRMLFTAPRHAGAWLDVVTGQPSVSLGREAYVAAMAAAGLSLVAEYDDEGDNHYYDCAGAQVEVSGGR